MRENKKRDGFEAVSFFVFDVCAVVLSKKHQKVPERVLDQGVIS